jgi:serine/threonine protein phosphatase PrpC
MTTTMDRYFESAAITDTGRKRKTNEDACLEIPERAIYCVADGMGGHVGGGFASEAVTRMLRQTFAEEEREGDGTLSKRITLVRRAANGASKWIKNFSDEKVIGQMGSTVVVLVIDPRNPARAVGLHAGDSRLYRYRQGELRQLTEDHSAGAAIMAKLGHTPVAFPMKYQNELLRWVGSKETVDLERTPVDVLSGDIFLLCSDGLTKMLPDGDIWGVLKGGAQTSPREIAEALVRRANDGGGNDNVSVVVVRVGDISAVPNVVYPEDDEERDRASQPAPSPGGESHRTHGDTRGGSRATDTGGGRRGDTPGTEEIIIGQTPNTVPNREGARELPSLEPLPTRDRPEKTKDGPPSVS